MQQPHTHTTTMANVLRSVKMRLARMFRGRTANDTIADGSAEQSHYSRAAKTSKSSARPVISGPLNSKAVANMLLPPTTIITTAPVEIPQSPAPITTDIQIFVTTADGIVAEAETFLYNDLLKTPAERTSPLHAFKCTPSITSKTRKNQDEKSKTSRRFDETASRAMPRTAAAFPASRVAARERAAVRVPATVTRRNSAITGRASLAGHARPVISGPRRMSSPYAYA